MVDKIPIPLRNAACQMLIRDPEVTRYGHLRRKKRVDILTDLLPLLNWSNSYVVLHGGVMYLYNDEASSCPDDAFSLFGYTQCQACPGETPAKVIWPFKLVNPLGAKDKCYYFSASSEKVMKEWISIIQGELEKVNSMHLNSAPRLHGNASDYDKVTSLSLMSENCRSFKRTIAVDLDDNASSKTKPRTAPTVLPRIISTDKPTKQREETGEDDVYKPGETYETGSEKDYFWNGPSSEADKLMKKSLEDGVFMIRKSSADDGTFTLLVRTPLAVAKFKILSSGDKLNIEGETLHFRSIEELVGCYLRDNLPNCNIKLGKPYKKIQPINNF